MIKTDIKLPFNYTDEDIFSALSMHIPVKRDEIDVLKIVKRTLNVSDKSNIHYTATVGISLSAEREAGLLKMKKKVTQMEDLSLNIPS